MSDKRQGARTVLDMKLVTGYWRRHKKQFLGFTALAVVNMALALAYPRLLGYIVDNIQAGLRNPQSFRPAGLLAYVAVLLGVGLASSFVGGWQPVAWYRASLRFGWLTRTAVFRKVLAKGQSFANRFPTGDVLQRLDSDLADVSVFTSTGVFWPLSSILTLVVALVILVRMSPLLTLVAVLPATLMVLVWYHIGPLIDRFWRDWREQMSATNNFLEASYSGIRLVKSCAMEDRNVGRFRAVLDNRVKAALRGARIQATSDTARNAISGLGIVFVLALGGSLVIRHSLTLGEFVTFNAYVMMLVWPMMAVADMFVWIKQTGVEEERVRALAEFRPDVDAGTGQRRAGGAAEIRLDDVSFNYPALRARESLRESGTRTGDSGAAPDSGRRTPGVGQAGSTAKCPAALSGISMTIRPGSRVGIAGTVGSGKSTIVRLLMRLAEPASGEITLGGLPLREYDIVSLRGLFGYAPQEPGLFSDTIAENVSLGRAGGDVREVASVAQLDEDLKDMPKGLDELIGERGLKLSGGQRGRVAIARALYGRPGILLLDDVTASLDAETEQRFIADFLSHARGATIVIVSHRLAILAACDVVYVLDAGRIVEQGKHAELLERRGTYWKLYQRQLAQQELGEA